MIASLRALALFLGVCGVLYPLLVTGIARVAFPREAAGNAGLLARKTTDPAYFWYRPSAADYATVPSGASNLSPTSPTFLAAVEARRKALGADAPADLLTTSASGLDPHVSPDGALFQVERVAKARGIGIERRKALSDLVHRRTEGKTWGILGAARVNVTELNIALDAEFPRP